MLRTDLWLPFLRERGVDLTSSSVTRLTGGEVNDNWKITDRDGRSCVARRYRVTLDPAELDCELAAVDVLARSGFPTPGPVPSGANGRFWDLIDGRPVALFSWAAGTHPPQRPGGYGSMDLELGRRTARLAGRLGITLAGRRLPGQRSPTRDAWRRIDSFLSNVLSGAAPEPIFADLLAPLREIRARLLPLYEQPPDDLPHGLIHNDMTPANLLLGPGGDVTALLDFDDCAQTFLSCELGAIVSAFGRDEQRRVDLPRTVELIAAYDAVRALTAAERDALPDLLAAHAAAEGLGVLSGWSAAGRPVTSPLESFSVRAFLELSASRDEMRQAIATGV